MRDKSFKTNSDVFIFCRQDKYNISHFLQAAHIAVQVYIEKEINKLFSAMLFEFFRFVSDQGSFRYLYDHASDKLFDTIYPIRDSCVTHLP